MTLPSGPKERLNKGDLVWFNRGNPKSKVPPANSVVGIVLEIDPAKRTEETGYRVQWYDDDGYTGHYYHCELSLVASATS